MIARVKAEIMLIWELFATRMEPISSPVWLIILLFYLEIMGVDMFFGPNRKFGIEIQSKWGKRPTAVTLFSYVFGELPSRFAEIILDFCTPVCLSVWHEKSYHVRPSIWAQFWWTFVGSSAQNKWSDLKIAWMVVDKTRLNAKLDSTSTDVPRISLI